MGNGASSSQGSLPSYNKRNVGTSVDSRKQHDWQPEQAEAPKQETHSLQVETRKPYTLLEWLSSCELLYMFYLVLLLSTRTFTAASAAFVFVNNIISSSIWCCIVNLLALEKCWSSTLQSPIFSTPTHFFQYMLPSWTCTHAQFCHPDILSSFSMTHRPSYFWMVCIHHSTFW